MKNERQLALEILLKIYRDKGYSNLTLSKMLSRNDGLNQAFITALIYGVIERDLTLAHVIGQYSKQKIEKLDLEVLLILKMGLYQLLYMDSVPDNAAVDESVKLCYDTKKVSAKGFVNGILRNFIRDGKKLRIQQTDDLKSLSIAYSCPLWLVQKWTEEYSYEVTKRFLQASIGRPPLTIRVNTLKTTTEELCQKLMQKHIQVTVSPDIENCLILDKTKSLEQLEAFQNGLFYVQDIASQICVKLAQVKPNTRVFDMCAAPGSKSFTMAQYMQNQGELFSFDLYEHKLQLIEKTAQRLGISNLRVQRQDACQYNAKLGQADTVLCDVPCAGLGIIRRKPEIKYKSKQEIEKLPEIQYQILSNSSSYVKSGGLLIYSTCSVNQEENQQVAQRFLKEHTDFMPVPIPEFMKGFGIIQEYQITLLPQFINSDGFFIARFKRK